MSSTYKVAFSPSQLRAMSEDQLSSLFHSFNWENIDANTKLNLCQELENRLAEMDGIEPRTVVAEQMNGSLYGVQHGNIIEINADMLNDGVFRTTYINENGKEVTSIHSVDAPNWNTYDTVAHEHTHGVSLDRNEMPYTYISSSTDYDLYRIQGEERAAFEKGNTLTQEAIARSEAAMGKQDYQKEEYLDSIARDSYEKSLENAKLKYNDPFIDKTLEQFIHDRDNGIHNENTSPSYKQIESLYNDQLQRQLMEILQSKEQLNDQNIANSGFELQNKTQQEINGTVNEFEVPNVAEATEENNDITIAATNDGSNSFNDNVVSYDDNGHSYDDGGALLDDNSVSYSDNGTSYDDGGASLDDNGVSYDDNGDSYDGGVSNDNGGASYDDSGASNDTSGASYDDGGASYE